MKLCIIAGPTASGKTALAIEVARRLDAEIVSADSQQVYRAFDIGTAKPTAHQLAAVPHHLISVVEPLADFSAAKFQALADAAIADIASRKKRVVVVGGTGLYLRVLLHGVVEAPPADEALRAELTAFAESNGNQALHARLQAVDPVSAQRLPINDRVRIIRALEITQLTSTPASARRASHGFEQRRHEADFWVLDPPREQVYAAINARTDAMFEAGLVEETKRLLAQGLREAAPMGAVGYAQALAVVEGRMSLAEAREDVAQKTRHYAKRQWTWFRKEPGARFIQPPYDVATISGA